MKNKPEQSNVTEALQRIGALAMAPGKDHDLAFDEIARLTGEALAMATAAPEKEIDHVADTEALAGQPVAEKEIVGRIEEAIAKVRRQGLYNNRDLARAALNAIIGEKPGD